MADDTRRAYAQSARGDRSARGEPSLEPGLGGEQRESVGERLKRERETYGLHLREVSESLRIRYAYLDAIERSAFDELPGPTYAVGFVRGYAQFLGLDDDRIVQRFKEESQGLKRDQQLHFPEPVNEGKIPGGTILLLSILLIAAAYGAWAYLSDGERSVADLVPEVPESLQQMVGATEQPPVPEATDLSGTRDDEAGGGSAGNGTADGGSGELDSEQVAELPETAPDPELSGDGAGQSDGDAADPATGDTATGETGTSNTGTSDTGTSDMGTGGTAAADQGGDAGGIPEAPDQGGDTQTAASPVNETSPANDPSPVNDASPSNGTASSGTGPQTAEAAGANPAPPAVPEMQQDDRGIPTVPDRTQTASSGTGDSVTGERATGESVTDGTGAEGSGADGRTFGASPANSRVTLVATARSWVQVRGPDDSLVLTRLLRPGDRYNVPDRQGLTLHTGNAGGLQVVVDGQDIGRLGDDGEVRRGVLLEPQALTAGG